MYALVGVLTAVLGLVAGEWVPQSFVTKIGSDSVGNILSILASSMLAVSTFSLSIMVTSFGNVAASATPRASKLLIENQNAQRAVATFIGAFLYGIVGIVALATGAYGEQGRFVLFVVTGLVIIFIVVTLIRWVDQLSTLGQIANTISQIERETLQALKSRAASPYFGGSKRQATFPSVEKVTSSEVGFVAYINIEALQSICQREKFELCLELLPGSFAYPGRPLATCSNSLSADTNQEVASHFVINPVRTFDQDPRFGLVLLSEIASRALSPGINDPGTAVEVIGAATRILAQWSDLKNETKMESVKCDQVFVPELLASELMENIFAPLARDGSSHLEVTVKILRSLGSLANYDADLYAASCRDYSELCLEYAKNAMTTEYEQKALDELRKCIAPF